MVRRWPVGVALVASLTGCGTSSTPVTGATSSPAESPTGTGTTAPAASPRPAAPGNDAAFDLEVPVGQLPRDLAIHDGRLWVANARSASVWGIDPQTGEVVAEVATGPRPIAFASVDDQLWVSVLGAGGGIIGEGIARIDAETEAVVENVEVPVQHELAVGGGSIWVLDGQSLVQRVDPSSGAITSSIDVGGRPVAVDAGDRRAWLVREDGTAVRIDVTSDSVSAEVDTGEPAPGRSMLLIVDDEVWIAVTGRVHVIDADDATVSGSVEIEGLTGTTGIAADERSVWLAATVTEPGSALTQGVVLRIDRSTREVADRYAVAGEPAGLALHGTSVWVADQERNVLLRLQAGAA